MLTNGAIPVPHIIVVLLLGLLGLGFTGAQTATIDYDADDDGLIEISNLEQLNAMRYDLDGDGELDESLLIDRGDSREADERAFTEIYRAAFPPAASGMGCPNSGCTGYELTRDLDFNDPDSYSTGEVNILWTGGVGWKPIGFEHCCGGITISLDGNGHTIANLFINRVGEVGSNYIGLSSDTTERSIIRNLGLVDVNVIGGSYVGALAGKGNGRIETCYATGKVVGDENVGGLVGQAYYEGSINASYAAITVTGNKSVGGLVGYNSNAILHSYATGRVTGMPGGEQGGEGVGGLVGRDDGTIIASFATGKVSGDHGVGGLVGNGEGWLVFTYSTGDVSGNTAVGGLVGSGSDVDIWAGYATGTVQGSYNVGGLVGKLSSSSQIAPGYATGNVSGNAVVGGLVGRNGGRASIFTSYAVGAVSGSQAVGGLIGQNEGEGERQGAVVASYWDIETTGQTVGVGTGPDSGTEGKTTAQLQAPTDYAGIYQAWNTDIDNVDEDRDETTGKDDFWNFGDSTQYPTFKCPELKLREEPETIAHIFLFLAYLSLEGTDVLPECPSLLPTPAITPSAASTPVPSPTLVTISPPANTPEPLLTPTIRLVRTSTPEPLPIPAMTPSPTSTPKPLPTLAETLAASPPTPHSTPASAPVLPSGGGGCGISPGLPSGSRSVDLLLLVTAVAMIWVAKRRTWR